MRRRRKLPPIPKDDGLVQVYSNAPPVTPEEAQRICQDSVQATHKPFWHNDPSYFWAEDVKRKRAERKANERTRKI